MDNAQKGWLRFGIRELLLIVAIFALAIGWWIDRRRLTSRLALFDLQVAKLKEESQFHRVTVAKDEPKSRFSRAADFVDFVETGNDWYKFQDEIGPFSRTAYADQAIPGLIALLDHSEPEVRYRALAALGSLKQHPELTVPSLVKALNDPHANVQCHAVFAIQEQQALEAVPALQKKMLDDDSEIATVAAVAANRLDPNIKIGSRLIELTKNKHRYNREQAATYLGYHVDFETADKVLAEMFEATDESDKAPRKTIVVRINGLKTAASPATK